MKIKDGFMLRNGGGRYVVVAVGKAAEEFNGLITLNESGAYLWGQLAEGCTYDDLLNGMLKEYDVTEMTARAGIDQFLQTARGAGIIAE